MASLRTWCPNAPTDNAYPIDLVHKKDDLPHDEMDCTLYKDKDDGRRRNSYPRSYKILRPKPSRSRLLSRKKFPVLKLMDIPISKLRSEDLEESRETVDRLEEQNVVLLKEIVMLKKTSEKLSSIVENFKHAEACVEQHRQRKKKTPVLSSRRRTDVFFQVSDLPSGAEKKSSLCDSGSINSFDRELHESKDGVDFVRSRKGAATLFSDLDLFNREGRKTTSFRPLNHVLGNVTDSKHLSRTLGKVTDSGQFSSDFGKVTDSGHFSRDWDKETDSGNLSHNSVIKLTRSERFDQGNMLNSKDNGNGWLKITDSGTIKSYNSQERLDSYRSSLKNDHRNSCSICQISETKVNDKPLNLLDPEIKYRDLTDCHRPVVLRDSPVPLADINIKDTGFSPTTVPSPDFMFSVSPFFDSQSTPQSPAPQYWLSSPDSDIFSDETTSSPNLIFPSEYIEFSPIDSLTQSLGLNSLNTPGGTFSSNLSFDVSTSHTGMNMYRGSIDNHRPHKPSALSNVPDEIWSEINVLETTDKISRFCTDSQGVIRSPNDVKEMSETDTITLIMPDLIRTCQTSSPSASNDDVSKSSTAVWADDENHDLDNIESFECEIHETKVDDVCQTSTDQHIESATKSGSVCLETSDDIPELLDITDRMSKICCGPTVHNKRNKAERKASESEVGEKETAKSKADESKTIH